MNKMNDPKPLGKKHYGTIGHIKGSKMNETDRLIPEGQSLICTNKLRDNKDLIWVLEKTDGANVGVHRNGDELIPLAKAGFRADSSPWPFIREFDSFVNKNKSRFLSILKDGERVAGEWMIVTHGSRYNLPHEPFIVFDILTGVNRLPFQQVINRVSNTFVHSKVLHKGGPIPVEESLNLLGIHGHHGCIDTAEGVIYRCERFDRQPKSKLPFLERPFVEYVDFLCKYVRQEFEPGKYLSGVNGKTETFYNQWMDNKISF
jgi:hypothetical protein